MQKELPKNFDDKEVKDLLEKICRPTFKFFLKKIEKEVLLGRYKKVSVDFFMAIFFISMSNIDGNLLRWIHSFYCTETGSKIPFQNIQSYFYQVLNDHVKPKNDLH
jgi:hypothetical protein